MVDVETVLGSSWCSEDVAFKTSAAARRYRVHRIETRPQPSDTFSIFHLPLIIITPSILTSRRKRETQGSLLIGCSSHGSRPLKVNNFLKQFFHISPKHLAEVQISIHLQRCQSFSRVWESFPCVNYPPTKFANELFHHLNLNKNHFILIKS